MKELTIVEYINHNDDSVDVLRKLEKTMMTIAREDPLVRSFYVGIASGTDYRQALRRRFDRTKKRWGINLMVAIFETPYQPHVRYAEGCLDRHFRPLHRSVIEVDPLLNDAEPLNGTGGGGGRNSSQPFHYIYVAVKHLGI